MHVVDEKGEKMSKSKGNIIDPQDVLKRYGAESFRIWTCLEGNITRGDIRCSYERIQGTSKFLTKLWNISRFLSSFPKATKDYELTDLDKLILAELNSLIKKCKAGYDQMDVYTPAQTIRAFTWNLFADHYIEAIKPRAYNQKNEFSTILQQGAWYTLHICLETILKLLAPICPFITEALWCELYSNQSIHAQLFPEVRPEWESELIDLTSQFMTFNTTIWKYKKERGVAFSQELAVTVYAPKELEPFKLDLKGMHRIKKLNFVESIEAEEKDHDVLIVD